MPNPRENRLNSDYQKVQSAAAQSRNTLRLVRVSGSPPTRYVIEFTCPSLVREQDRKLSIRQVHQVEISLGREYPLPGGRPTARLITPVFNPHVFESGTICLGEWKPTETLDALVFRIGALLQWDPKVLNPHSPANHEAMNWALQHPEKLPLGTVTFKAGVKPENRIQWT
jgi:ubiquitin-protein ligase